MTRVMTTEERLKAVQEAKAKFGKPLRVDIPITRLHQGDDKKALHPMNVTSLQRRNY